MACHQSLYHQPKYKYTNIVNFAPKAANPHLLVNSCIDFLKAHITLMGRVAMLSLPPMNTPALKLIFVRKINASVFWSKMFSRLINYHAAGVCILGCGVGLANLIYEIIVH